MTAPSWRSRIVGSAEVAPADLLAHPDNPRLHPLAQREFMAGVLDQVGWIDSVKVSVRSGRIIDGHMRVDLAAAQGEPSVPVIYVDLSEAEELQALATFDPIGALAVTDRPKLQQLLADARADVDAARRLLQEVEEREMGAVELPPGPSDAHYRVNPIERHVEEMLNVGVTEGRGSEGQPVKAIQLYLTIEEYGRALEHLDVLARRYGAETVTETIKLAIREQATKC